MQIDDWTFRDVAVRYKGNGSYLRATRAGSDKISLKVDLNRFVKGQKLAGLTTINFQNNITDAGWMNEVLAYRLYRDAGALAPRSTYARVYLTVDGQSEKRFLGLYSVSENVDENFFEERFGTRKGAILKPSTQDLFTDWGADWSDYDQSYDPKTDLTDAQKARIIELGRLVSHATDEEFAARIGDYVGPRRLRALLRRARLAGQQRQPAAERAELLHLPASRHEPDALHRLGPGLLVRQCAQSRTSWPIHLLVRQQPVPVAHLPHRGVRSKYFARLSEFSERLLVPDRFQQQITEIASAIRPVVELEGKEWLRDFDRIAAGEAGIVPYVKTRNAYVKSELERGSTTK
jgi:hypothetical protein